MAERPFTDPGEDAPIGDYIVVKALDNGVNLIGMTRGRDTRLLHTEKLDKGEVIIAQFTENTSAMKIRGKARIYTAFGTIESGDASEEGRTPHA